MGAPIVPFDAEICKHRTAQVTAKFVSGDGRPMANREVTLSQANHKFLFGCTAFEVGPLANGELSGVEKDKAEAHAEKLVSLFNFQTLPFYWGWYEGKEGQPDTRRMLKAAKYLQSRGCIVKGHPLCWHSCGCDWLMAKSNEQIIDLQRKRITRDVTDFAGVIDSWDVINEVVIMPVFDRYDNAITRICRQLGRIPMIRMVFEQARAANPKATLLLNDFDMSTAYECLIEGVLEAGIKIDALGLQSHMHQGYWGVEKTLGVLERFSRFGLPIHFTESSLVSGHIMPAEIVDLNDYQVPEWPSTPEGEERQAIETEQHYRALFAHPSVQAVTWWGINDGGWLRAPSGLLRADDSVKPAYRALERLIKGAWWLKPTKYQTNAQGEVCLHAFLGDFKAEMGGRSTSFKVDSAGSLKVTVQL